MLLIKGGIHLGEIPPQTSLHPRRHPTSSSHISSPSHPHFNFNSCDKTTDVSIDFCNRCCYCLQRETTSMFSNIFMILNWIAFFGWTFICYKLSLSFLFRNDDDDDIDIVQNLQKPVLVLEGICAIEVLRILVGQLKGNFVLGVVLHAIRLLTVLETMVRLPTNHWTGPIILSSWAVTEICRYPMYMFPTNQLCRSIRMVVPVVTFPIGAFSEAYGAYLVFCDPESPFGLKVALSSVLFVNGALGPTMAYPALLKKGLPILGLTKIRRKEKKNQKQH